MEKCRILSIFIIFSLTTDFPYFYYIIVEGANLGSLSYENVSVMISTAFLRSMKKACSNDKKSLSLETKYHPAGDVLCILVEPENVVPKISVAEN